MEVLSADSRSKIGREGAGYFRNRSMAAERASAGWTGTIR